MKILWESEDWPGARIEPSITYLSWIPQPDAPGHGLLGIGSDSGSVGVTFTDFRPTPDDNSRYNFNLRGHHTAVRMVTWNKSQCKLASCDASGIIYVWVRNDDRWSVELVNDRGVKVNDLCWSPCGSSALICYEDNFVLIGSASGQRVWSNSFPSGPLTTVTCGVWAPDSKQLVLGFSSGSIQVLSNQGANITERSFTTDRLQQLAFSPIRTKDTNSNSMINREIEEWTLAMITATNKVIMIDAYDQFGVQVYKSPHQILHCQWNSDGTILAMINSANELLMLDTKANVIHRETINVGTSSQEKTEKSLTAFTWAHDGQAIIVASGGHLAVGKLLQGVPSLFDMVAYDVWKLVGSNPRRAEKLPLPRREMSALKSLDHHIIRCRIPRSADLCSFVCSVVEARCYCTIRPMSRGSHSYMLCIEHMGGLVPLLVGRQVNRFLPQFQIFLHPSSPLRNQNPPSTGSCAQVEDINGPLARISNGRNSLWRRSKRQIRALMSRHVRQPRQDTRLLQVSSNVWCTRFSITSLSPTNLPSFLGQVVYKTSVLHLQPRQMTIELTVLNENTRTKERQQGGRDEIQDERTATTEQGLTCEERRFFEKVLSECKALRAAMDATPVDESTSCKPSTSYKPAVSTSNTAAGTTTASTSKAQSSNADSRIDVTSMTSSVSSWHEEIETLEFIDGDDETALCSSSRPMFKSSATKEGNMKKETEEIRANVEKLQSIAQSLSKRHDFDFNSTKDIDSIMKMRSQMKEMLRRVNDIEKKVSSSDVKNEVRQLMKTLKEMKRVLGEGPPTAHHRSTTTQAVTMHNKTPFWNEHNQVYQLDFGGRVTQESAKNFQVEMDGKQVLQFGRIEGGAYTLDFRQPFSASQAFAVALASITQRLK